MVVVENSEFLIGEKGLTCLNCVLKNIQSTESAVMLKTNGCNQLSEQHQKNWRDVIVTLSLKLLDGFGSSLRAGFKKRTKHQPNRCKISFLIKRKSNPFILVYCSSPWKTPVTRPSTFLGKPAQNHRHHRQFLHADYLLPPTVQRTRWMGVLHRIHDEVGGFRRR